MTSATRNRSQGRRDPSQRTDEQQATAAASPAPTTATLRLSSKPGSFGPVRLQQLVLIEVAAALLLAAWTTQKWLLVPAAVVAGLLTVLALVRRRQHPLSEWYELKRSLRRRKRGAKYPIPAGTDPSLTPAVECDPALQTSTYVTREDRAIGMVGDGTFLTALIAVEGKDAPLRPGRTGRVERPVPLDVLHDALSTDDIRLESVQIVQHTQPAPAPHLPGQSVVARSYGMLQEASGIPSLRMTWVALKLTPELTQEAIEARGGGLGGAQRSLARAADQLASRLEGAGFSASVLNESEVVQALATSTCLNPRVNSATSQDGRNAQRRTEESVRGWRCDDRWHSTFWISRWPQVGPNAVSSAHLASILTSLRVFTSVFSLTIGRGDGRSAEIAGHVRIVTRSEDDLSDARRELQRTASRAKTGLVPLDREQVPGVLATLPLGGTA
ncbi:type VII secretion protein EccE [Streptomyces sp. Amel2xB2]|uniref:Type VII secretion protein EccE n=1 Tax=Streptomyces nanshensis TaxID=518642 RepID=A0A1E7L1R9_9ACTN|nr:MULTISPECIES: type VII secretion protein EccE [Streptomyces]OEV10134.1 type VII secretion protein EccE [Streptomyces nanshensis]RAJ63558.1 type VII secretion protein EccE [Streptomyces sp. Amel2xB2]